MKAVIWTDVLQTVIMFVGMLAGIIQGLWLSFLLINRS